MWARPKVDAVERSSSPAISGGRNAIVRISSTACELKTFENVASVGNVSGLSSENRMISAIHGATSAYLLAKPPRSKAGRSLNSVVVKRCDLHWFGERGSVRECV